MSRGSPTGRSESPRPDRPVPSEATGDGMHHPPDVGPLPAAVDGIVWDEGSRAVPTARGHRGQVATVVGDEHETSGLATEPREQHRPVGELEPGLPGVLKRHREVSGVVGGELAVVVHGERDVIGGKLAGPHRR